MSAASKVILILGAGANVGEHVTRAFASKGYKVALAARSAKESSNPDQINIQSDFTDPSSIEKVFQQVKSSLGVPSVVIYNAGAGTSTDVKNPLALPLADFVRDLNVNTVSAYVAAQQAALGFQKLPETASRTFIFTGNALNEIIIPALMDAGVGKSGTAHFIRVAAEAYKDQGFKFYYADERKIDGAPAYADISGEAHGEYYLKLAEDKSQGPWQSTFVKGVGYKQFL